MNGRQRLYEAIKAAREGRSEWATIEGRNSALPRGLLRIRLAAMRPLADLEPQPHHIRTICHRKAIYVLLDEREWPYPHEGWCLGKVVGRVKLVRLSLGADGDRLFIDNHHRGDKALLAVVTEIHPRSAVVPCAGTGKPLLESPVGPGYGSRCSECGEWFYHPGGQMAPLHEAAEVTR